MYFWKQLRLCVELFRDFKSKSNRCDMAYGKRRAMGGRQNRCGMRGIRKFT